MCCVCVCMHTHTVRWVVISRLVQEVLILWLYIHQGWREQAGVCCDRYSAHCANFCCLLSKNIVHTQVIWDKCNYPGLTEGKRETQRVTDLLTFTYRWFSLPAPLSTPPPCIMLLGCSSLYNAKPTPTSVSWWKFSRIQQHLYIILHLSSPTKMEAWNVVER